MAEVADGIGDPDFSKEQRQTRHQAEHGDDE